MALYHVLRTAEGPPRHGRSRRFATVVVVAFVIAIAVPLAATSGKIASDTRNVSRVNAVAVRWAEPAGWRVDTTEAGADAIVVHASARHRRRLRPSSAPISTPPVSRASTSALNSSPRRQSTCRGTSVTGG